MKKLSLLLLLFVLAGSIAAEENELRLRYKETFAQMQEFHKSLYFLEAGERSGHAGVGISGDFIFDIDWATVRQSEMRQGFVSLSANYWFSFLFNVFIEGGLHRNTPREVLTLSAMLQFLGPGQLERDLNGTGFEAGFKSYISNITGESVTCFKIGICSYRFLTKNLATEFGIDWLTPSYLGNGFELRGGLKYYFF